MTNREMLPLKLFFCEVPSIIEEFQWLRRKTMVSSTERRRWTAWTFIGTSTGVLFSLCFS
ncbi:MAG: hypothetical protein BWY92_01230 [Firmicutes bacterium ADurb.BinA052]|nr:MAG: hypothetical protein BWY92_01230 [Firmicutes bacterium ADurb.BinA052]